MQIPGKFGSPSGGAADPVADPQDERKPSLRLGRGRSGRAADRGIELDEAVERSVELRLRPRPRLLDELLGPERLQAERPDERPWARSPGEMIGDLDELADAAVELGHDDEVRRRVEEPFEQLERAIDPALRDRVEERPRRARHDFRDEGTDVVDRDDGAGTIERQLVELADRELALAPPIDVALAHEPADAKRDLARGTRRERHVALLRAALDPRRELTFLGRLQLANRTAGRRNRLRDRVEGRGSAGAIACLEEHERVARRHVGDECDERVAILFRPREWRGIDDEDERPATEHRRRPDPLGDATDRRRLSRDPPSFESRCLGLERGERGHGLLLDAVRVVPVEVPEARRGGHRLAPERDIASSSAAWVHARRLTSPGATCAARHTSRSSRAARAITSRRSSAGQPPPPGASG